MSVSMLPTLFGVLIIVTMVALVVAAFAGVWRVEHSDPEER